MFRVQVLLFLTCLAAAAEPLVGEAGLAELSAARAAVRVVSGSGVMTVVRADEPDEPGMTWNARFAAATDGRYDVVLSDAGDPAGARERYLCVADEVVEVVQLSIEDAPQIKRRRASDDLFATLMACVRLDPAVLQKDYAITLAAGEAGQRVLRLIPTRAEILREVASINVILDASGRPKQLAVLESSGNLRRLVLGDFTDDPQLEPGWFVPPPR